MGITRLKKGQLAYCANYFSGYKEVNALEVEVMFLDEARMAYWCTLKGGGEPFSVNSSELFASREESIQGLVDYWLANVAAGKRNLSSSKACLGVAMG